MIHSALLSSFIAQLCLAILAIAAPVGDNTLEITDHGNAWQYGTGGGILGLIVLILDIFAFIEVLKSNRPPVSKILWCLLIFFFPIIGVLIYWLFSNRAAHGSGSGYEPVG